MQYTNFWLPASGTTKNECGTVKGRKTSNKILDKKKEFSGGYKKKIVSY